MDKGVRGFPTDQGFDSIGLRRLSLKPGSGEPPQWRWISQRSTAVSMTSAKCWPKSVGRLGSAPAAPVGADTPALWQAVARRDAVHHGAVSPLALQELQGVLPLRHRRSVSRLLCRAAAL